MAQMKVAVIEVNGFSLEAPLNVKVLFPLKNLTAHSPFKNKSVNLKNLDL